MKKVRNFEEANAVLAQFVPTAGAAKAYTLERMQALMDYLGNPQDKLKVIHVAGTSGKTSTCYYVAALLQAAGHKVGLSVSPHVAEINERVQINLVPMPEAEFCNELSEFLELIAKSDIRPTYFELLVAFAYWQFAKQQVDYAVMEVGLGGLLDGTNVISRADKVCIITDIGLDHVNVLGTTLSEITTQKAGIIQPGNHVFAYTQNQDVDAVLMRTADKKHATLHRITALEQGYYQPSLPLFQQRNLYLAEQAVNYILERDKQRLLTWAQIEIAIAIRIPARMEIFTYKDKTIILDGAHNGQKLHAFIESVRYKFPDKPAAALIGFAASRDYRLQSSISEIISMTKHIIVTRFKTGQDLMHKSADTDIIVRLCKQQGSNEVVTIKDIDQAINELLVQPEPLLLVTGSFYLLYHVRPLLLELIND